MLSPDERRRFRQLERGLHNTDPDWLARHHPWRRRCGDLVRLVAVAIASALLWLGAVTAVMPNVLGGILLLTAAATSFVSSRSATASVHDAGTTTPRHTKSRSLSNVPGVIDNTRS